VAGYVNDALETYRFHEAQSSLRLLLGEFCDWYLELIKPPDVRRRRDKNAAQTR